MDLSNLKSGLFGYNKLAVSNYVSSLESESNQKIQDLQKESKEAQDSLRGQLDALRAKYDEDIQKLIVARATAGDILKVAKAKGVVTMRQDGVLKALSGITTLKEVDRVASDLA